MATDFEKIFGALTQSKVDFVVVGGVAVVLQGHPRLTADLDLAFSLTEENAKAAMQALTSLGYQPKAPVTAADFASPAVRRRWVEEKNLVVLSFWSPQLPQTEVDVFVEEPIPFEELKRHADVLPLGASQVAVASIDDLIRMKERVARPRDLEDVAELKKLRAMRKT